jgi:hypothetical protein
MHFNPADKAALLVDTKLQQQPSDLQIAPRCIGEAFVNEERFYLRAMRLERPTVVWFVGMERGANRDGMSGDCMLAVVGGGVLRFRFSRHFSLFCAVENDRRRRFDPSSRQQNRVVLITSGQ